MIYFLNILLLFTQSLFVSRPVERWLLELKPNSYHLFEEWWKGNNFEREGYQLKKLPIENWFVVEVPIEFERPLRDLSCVNSMIEDMVLTNRTIIPNDPEFYLQSNMELIGMPEAWEIATGGLTRYGDTIVIAAIDDGFQLNHEDLVDNLWHNSGEIPNDGMDNDNNGFIDDYIGININTGRDNHPLRSHGTSVSGIIGAKGNNNLGISGINWDVKVMPISYDHRISSLVQAYQYVLNMRRKYRESNGNEGAFIVAVNLSSGIDFALPETFPLWCAMYDSLGKEGILSVCSGPNGNYSVDREGELPARCPSPYTIMVTNVTPDDELAENAGYGRISIDIGAPGDQSLTTDTNTTYNYFRGTSAAAPHVTATVGLLYEILCEDLLDSIKLYPDRVAIKLKNIILSSGTYNETLEGLTVSNNRLHVGAALKLLQDECQKKNDDKILIRFIAPNPTGSGKTRLYFETIDPYQTLVFEIYSFDGRLIVRRNLTPEESAQGFVGINTKNLAGGAYVLSIGYNNVYRSATLIVK